MLVYFFWIYVYLGMWVIFLTHVKLTIWYKKMFFHVYIPLEISIEWNIFCFLTANREKQESCIVTVTVVVILFVFNRWRWCQPSGGINAVRLSRGSRCGAFSFSQNDAKLNSEHNKHLAEEEISSPCQSDAVKETDHQRQTKLPSLKAASAVQ